MIEKFSFIVNHLSNIRLLLYKYNIFQSYSFNIPIISVGNIEFGGTGKTPMVSWLINEYHKKNKRVCVISRGYGRVSKKTIVATKNTNNTINEIGDEPFMLINDHPNVIVVVSNKKIESAGFTAKRSLDLGIKELIKYYSFITKKNSNI